MRAGLGKLNLVNGILNLFRTDYKPAPGEFLPIDRQSVVQKLQIREIGRERGARGVPPPDASDLDTVEQEITEAIKSRAAEERHRAVEQLRYYQDQLRTADPEGAAASILATAQRSITTFKSELLSVRAELDQARRNVVQRELAFSEFKSSHGLNRPPVPPKGHFKMYALLAIIFLIETIPNGYFLGEGSDFGFAGGYIIAIVFSAFNLLFGFFAGFFGITHLTHRSSAKKLAGFLAVVVFLLLTIGMNFLAAHYRGAVTSGMSETEAAMAAPRLMRADPWSFLDDTRSILMVVIGLFVAFVAMLEGYFWQDPYPGYARNFKHLQQAEDYWSSLVNDSIANLREIYDADTRQIQALQASLRDRQLILPEIIGNRHRLVDAFNAHLTHLSDVGRYLVDVYRESNIETRKVAKPDYFGRSWQLTGVEPIAQPDEIKVNEGQFASVGAALVEATSNLSREMDNTMQWIAALGGAASAVHADAHIAREGAEAKRTSGAASYQNAKAS
jgi:hypothetical protein